MVSNAAVLNTNLVELVCNIKLIARLQHWRISLVTHLSLRSQPSSKQEKVDTLVQNSGRVSLHPRHLSFVQD